jgi:hypothetical protein
MDGLTRLCREFLNVEFMSKFNCGRIHFTENFRKGLEAYYIHIFYEIPTSLHNSLNPRPELLAGRMTTSLSKTVIIPEIMAWGEVRVL